MHTIEKNHTGLGIYKFFKYEGKLNFQLVIFRYQIYYLIYHKIIFGSLEFPAKNKNKSTTKITFFDRISITSEVS